MTNSPDTSVIPAGNLPFASEMLASARRGNPRTCGPHGTTPNAASTPRS